MLHVFFVFLNHWNKSELSHEMILYATPHLENYQQLLFSRSIVKIITSIQTLRTAQLYSYTSIHHL